jgi:ammonium transporter
MTQVGIQAASVLATIVYAGAVSWILLKIVDKVIGLRVTADERMGLELSLHGERIE